MPASWATLEQTVAAGCVVNGAMVTKHAVVRWHNRVHPGTPPERVVSYLQEAWRRKDRFCLGVLSRDSYLYRVGRIRVVVRWSVGVPWIVTVLGPVGLKRRTGK